MRTHRRDSACVYASKNNVVDKVEFQMTFNVRFLYIR